MKKISYFIGFFSVFFSFEAGADSFIDGMEDVPVAPGFVQAQADTISFGGVDSHFLEAVLVSEDEAVTDSYRKYYLETMPQLGWKLSEDKALKLIFYRGEETLEITQEYAKPLTLRINIYGEN